MDKLIILQRSMLCGMTGMEKSRFRWCPGAAARARPNMPLCYLTAGLV